VSSLSFYFRGLLLGLFAGSVLTLWLTAGLYENHHYTDPSLYQDAYDLGHAQGVEIAGIKCREEMVRLRRNREK
jgi:hypothetical protein